MRKVRVESVLKNFCLTKVFGKESVAGETIRINISDMIYVLDIRNKNQHIDRTLDKYRIDKSSVGRIKTALEKGRWRVLG